MDNKVKENIIYGGPLPYNYAEGCCSFGEFIQKRLREHKENIVLVDAVTNEEITALQLLSESIKVAQILQANGLKKGDTILLISEDRIEFANIIFGAIYLGVCTALIDPNYYNEDELSHIINEILPTIIFTSYTCLAALRNISGNFKFIEKIILFGENWDGDHILSYSKWISCLKNGSFEDYFKCAPTNMDENVAIILQTSGTTNIPKNILVTQTNLLLSSILYSKHYLTPKPIALSVVSWVHGIGIKMLLRYTLNNVRFVFMPRLTYRELLRTIQKYKVNIAWIHPKIISFLCENPIVQNYDIYCLRILYTGGRALTQNQLQAVSLKLPYAIVRQVYGMVELAYIANQTDDRRCTGSVGILQPGVHGKIIDVKSGHILGSQQYGEICFKGPVLMKGYIGEANNNSIDSDKWLHSGDIGYYDENQEWFLVCRKSDLIYYNGQTIVPSVSENILNEIPDVKECSIVGIPNDKCGETPVVFIVKNPESVLSEKDFRNIVEKNSPPNLKLNDVVFIKELPRSAIVGKVLKNFLKKFYKSDLNENYHLSYNYIKWYNNNK